MNHPAFFEEVRTITLRDPLASVLGVSPAGLMRYSYLDAVKLAGHSCPTVAGAYLMTLKALEKLYPHSVPERGSIRVELGSPQTEGTTGVVSAVAGLITGAASEGGFKGLAGRFSRQNLLRFASGDPGDLRFTRLDTGQSLAVRYHPEIVPPAPEMQTLMQKVQSGDASADEIREFGKLWQLRVKHILIDLADDPGLVTLSPVPGGSPALQPM